MPKADRGACDFEAYEWTKPFLLAIVSPSHSELLIDATFNKPERFAEFCLLQLLKRTREGKAGEWWAHNAGKYDGLLLSAAAKRLGWNQTGILAGGSRVITWRYFPRGSTVSVILNDSFAVLPNKLADIATDFDLPSRKLFEKDDYSHFDTRDRAYEYWQANTDRIKQGCITDARLVLEGLDKVETLIEDWGGQLKHTFSSSALSIILSHLRDSRLEWPCISPRVNTFARSGYYGARVEVFRHSPGRISEYDINSSYPYAMTHNLPWNYAGHVHGSEAQHAFDKGYAGIYEATVDIPRRTYIPSLPYVGPDGGLYFPVGRWRAYFPGNELAYSIGLQTSVTIHSAIIFSQGKPFSEFVNKVYDLRRVSIGALKHFLKLLLNGSYGKSGEKPEKEQLRVFAEAAEAISYAWNNPGTVTQLGPDPCVCSVEVFRWPQHTHYALASYITAYARMHLHRLLLSAVEPAYCDSDSIHCAVDGIAPEEINSLLGGLKEEIHEGEATYYAPKMYEILDTSTGGTHFACKGFPVEAMAFRKMVAGEDVSRERMVLAKTQLRRGGERVSRQVDTKGWKGKSMKRCALSATESRPWTVDEILRKIHLDEYSPVFKGKKHK